MVDLQSKEEIFGDLEGLLFTNTSFALTSFCVIGHVKRRHLELIIKLLNI